MLPLLEKIAEQVTSYSTVFGQVWYIFVFVFRLIVVVTIGDSVYSDEQSEFKCSTGVVGCENVCFNEFSKISHIRFWAFQLLAVVAPTVFFHFYSMYINGEIQKLKKEEDEQRNMEEGKDFDQNFKRMSKRRKSIGRVRVRQRLVESDLRDVAFTRNVHVAYFINVVLRVIIEGMFIRFAYNLFRFMNPVADDTVPLDFLWFRVPLLYYCHGAAVNSACHQHLMTDPLMGDDIKGYVPCWVSRPWEKTIFLRYMNILSGICFLLSLLEFLYLVYRGIYGGLRKRKKNRKLQKNEIPMYSTAPLYDDNYPSTLAVPVCLSEIIKEQEHRERSYSKDRDFKTKE